MKTERELPVFRRSVFPTMNNLFSELFDGVVAGDFRKWNMPAVNIIENDQSFILKVAAPGLKKEDFKINVDDDLLVISASAKEDKEVKNERYTRKEYAFSSFSRSFTLPENVDRDGIRANYEQGEMSITLPKQETAKAKSREITIG